MIDDSDFKVNSVVAVTALETANKMKSWASRDENKDEVQQFSQKLVTELEKLFVGTVTTSSSVIKRDKLWKSYFLLRSSEQFVELWHSFLELAAQPKSALFYQHITDIIFKSLIKQHYQVCLESADVATMDCRERNALRYAAGYVCRHLRSKLEKSNCSAKEELILCLMTLTKGGNFEEDLGADEEWTELIDRGGLWHIKENTFHLFCALEEEVQLQLKSLPKQTTSRKKEMIDAVIASEDVQFYWLIVSADFEVEGHQIHALLLRKITELFLTVRGFAFASMWLEKYKQAERKTTQRSKSLRRDVLASIND